jgi:hypothetical protein
VHYGIRLFGLLKALQSSERPSRRVGQVRLRSHLVLDPKRSGNRSRSHPPLCRDASPLYAAIFTSSAFVCSIAPLRLSCFLLLSATMGVVERIVDLP